MPTNRLSRSTSSPTVDFYLQADELSNDPATNQHVVRCYLVAINRGNTSTYYSGTTASVSGSVDGTGFSVTGTSAKLASGTANGAAFWTHGPYDITVTGNANGTASVDLALSVSYPGVSGGGSTSGSLTLATLTAAPGVPSGAALVRSSDTQSTLSWTDTSPTNGQPTTNQIQTSVNGAAFLQVASITPATSLVIGTAANQKVTAKVRTTNSAGSSAYSSASNAIYTTPAAPTAVAATKTGTDIVVTWTDNVAFTEHKHRVESANSTDGGATWSAWSVLTSTAISGTYTHTAPDAAKLWRYRVSAINTDVAALTSATVTSNTVQLLAAPNAPTFGSVPSYANKAANLIVPWTHNPVDTTGQTAYEFGYSTNGGSTWSSTGKITSATSSYTITASTYAANAAVTMRVRTWGAATTGGSDTTGASPWSTTTLVTFKTIPVATITTPAAASTYTQATLTVVLGFSQAESATFVQATIGLYNGATLLEQVDSTTLAGTTLATRVADGGSYTVKATVLDSNGLTSTQVSSAFSVAYTLPVTAAVTATYLPDSGITQLDLTLPSPGVGEVAATVITITRTIDGATETVIDQYPAAPSLTILDMTPTISGSNLYTVTTFSADGATVETPVTLVTTEPYWAFLNTGTDFTNIIKFMGDLKFAATPARAMTLVDTAGRSRPIALFGPNGSLVVSGSATLFPDEGSTVAEVEAFLLIAETVYYRDPSGRRMKATVTGSLDSPSSLSSGFTFTVTEVS